MAITDTFSIYNIITSHDYQWINFDFDFTVLVFYTPTLRQGEVMGRA